MKIKSKVKFVLGLGIITLIAIAMIIIGTRLFMGTMSGNFPFVEDVISMNSKLAIVIYLAVLLMTMYGIIPILLGIGIIVAEVRIIKKILLK